MNNNNTKSIKILDSRCLEATLINDEKVVLNPQILVSYYEDIEEIKLKGAFEEYAEIALADITEIDGVAFSGTFADLRTAIDALVISANYSSGSGTSEKELFEIEPNTYYWLWEVDITSPNTFLGEFQFTYTDENCTSQTTPRYDVDGLEFNGEIEILAILNNMQSNFIFSSITDRCNYPLGADLIIKVEASNTVDSINPSKVTVIDVPTLLAAGSIEGDFGNVYLGDNTQTLIVKGLEAINAKSDTSTLNNAIIQQTDFANITRPTSFPIEVLLGRREGYKVWNKWGYNGDVDTGTETLWNVGGTFARLTSAQTLNIVSTSANDTNAAGTGAQQVKITGIDASYNEIEETVLLNGTTIVTTTNSFIGINRKQVSLNGTGIGNAGVITATGSTDLTIQARIDVGIGSTQQALFFTANNSTTMLNWLLINVTKLSGGGGAPRVTVKMFVTNLVTNARIEVYRESIDTDIENHIDLSLEYPFLVQEKSLIELSVTTDTNNTVASGRFGLVAYTPQ